jgi:hypothetical protein
MTVKELKQNIYLSTVELPAQRQKTVNPSSEAMYVLEVFLIDGIIKVKFAAKKSNDLSNNCNWGQ